MEGISGLKYRYGLSGALPLGFVESAQYPRITLEKLPVLMKEQQNRIGKLESELPTLQEIVSREWDKADELARLTLECKELQRKIEADLNKTEQQPETSSEPETEIKATEKVA